jgi:threonine synthase
MYLRCIDPACHKTYALHEQVLACSECADLLEAVVELSADPEELKRSWRQRRCSDNPLDRSGVWRFRDVLPNDYAPETVVTLAEGNIALVRGRLSAEWAGSRSVWFKHLGWNPTACFKDLGMTVGITEAKHLGAKAVGCASTGNTAGSMAAYAARAGITAKVFLPAGAVSLNKVAQSLDFGAEVVEMEGNFDAALDALLCDRNSGLYFLNSINPFRVEGQKTVMYELMEQLGWEPPDFIFVPGGNLGNSAAFGKALEEMAKFGFIKKIPRLVVVQAHGSNALVRTAEANDGKLHPVQDPQTFATAIRIGNPKSWKKSLRGVRFTNGIVTDVTDPEIAEAKAIIGRDGIGCEPASATTLAGLRKLIASGEVDRDATVVAILTGHALKDTDFIIKSHQRQFATAETVAR